MANPSGLSGPAEIRILIAPDTMGVFNAGTKTFLGTAADDTLSQFDLRGARPR